MKMAGLVLVVISIILALPRRGKETDFVRTVVQWSQAFIKFSIFIAGITLIFAG